MRAAAGTGLKAIDDMGFLVYVQKGKKSRVARKSSGGGERERLVRESQRRRDHKLPSNLDRSIDWRQARSFSVVRLSDLVREDPFKPPLIIIIKTSTNIPTFKNLLNYFHKFLVTSKATKWTQLIAIDSILISEFINQKIIILIVCCVVLFWNCVCSWNCRLKFASTSVFYYIPLIVPHSR